ncbi:hypothetical protein FQA39_LY05045 [Lamprigera yunnana]|nr:hypothetical protein FQA39_LY05045 [Lamprigera yunnana]
MQESSKKLMEQLKLEFEDNIEYPDPIENEKNERILFVEKKLTQLDNSMSNLSNELQAAIETHINSFIHLINDKPKFDSDKVNSGAHKRNKENNECIGMTKQLSDLMNKDKCFKVFVSGSV